MVAIVLNALVTTLLIATLVYCGVLHRRLEAVRRGQAEMMDLAASFNQATERAAQAVADLKATHTALGAATGPLIEKARQIQDDLAFMVDRGDAAADRLERAVRESRSGTPEGARPWPAPMVDLARPGAAEAAPSLQAKPPAAARSRVAEDLKAAIGALRARG